VLCYYYLIWTMATVWMTVTLLHAEGCTSYVCHMSKYPKVQIYTLLYVMIRSISQYLQSRLCHCKANIVHNCGPYFIWYASMSLASSSVLPLTPLLPLSCWPWLFPGCSSIVRICNSCLYAFQLKVHEMHLWAISENWFIIDWSTFSSLMKFKIHLHNSWPIYKKSNRNV